MTRVLTLPGWLNSGTAHWQSRWEALYGYTRVEQADWQWPRRGDWMARLDEVLLASGEPAVLAAHSLGCQLVAAWAAHSQHTARVRGALLVAPPDVEREDMPPAVARWRPIVRAPLPFAATAVLSTDDPYCALDRAQAMAHDWGAQVVVIGAVGHINGESALGDWDQGHAWLQQMLRE
jgi:uncharacterized protein